LNTISTIVEIDLKINKY